uniref:Caspase 8-like protein n=1 Tax=Dugesia japonica TaxID=6161 RepID=A0A221C9K7_DUGJA|nr:caspase 8-like protein [Dugesia japonica]
MSYLNKSDFINLKYLIVSTGLVRNEDIVDLKDERDLIPKLINHLEKVPGIDNAAHILEELLNESFYYLKHYAYLHKNGVCPLSYEASEWGINLTDESILLLRLYQNLSQHEFFFVLDNFMGVQKEIYLNLQMDFNNLNASDYLPKVYDWLHQQRNPLAEKLEILIKDRFGDFETKPESVSLNPSAAGFQGVCLIINNENFQSMKYKKREGTQVDEDAIFDTFSKLNFNVLVYKDVKRENINKTLDHAKSLVEMKHRMFITFVLSHGEEGRFITSDDKEMKFEELWGHFRGSQFKPLIGKPKLFFFVCCQGLRYNQTVCADEITEDSETIEFDSISSPSGHPDIADFFFGYATYKSLRSFRSTLNGTFYVKFLCASINENPKKSIHDIHIEVQRSLAKSKIPQVNSFQMAYYENLLREHCCFAI